MNPYDVLGIPTDSSEEVVEKTFKKLALQYHPDKNDSPDATEKFQEISKARDSILKGQGQFTQGQGQGQMPEEMMNFLNKMHQLKRVKLHTTLHLSLEEVYDGGVFEVTFDKPELTGKYIQTFIQMGPIQFNQMTPETINKVTKTKILVPKNYKCESGDIVERIDENTDLFITIIEKEHSVYKRQGSDLCLTLNITLKEALLGFSREIIHLNGSEIQLDCKNIIEPYMEKKIEESGFDDSGYLIIKFNIDFPKELNESVKLQLQEIL